MARSWLAPQRLRVGAVCVQALAAVWAGNADGQQALPQVADRRYDGPDRGLALVRLRQRCRIVMPLDVRRAHHDGGSADLGRRRVIADAPPFPAGNLPAP